MVELSATRCSCIAILWGSLVSFAAITFCVASQPVFTVSLYFVIDSVRKVLDATSYNVLQNCVYPDMNKRSEVWTLRKEQQKRDNRNKISNKCVLLFHIKR
jgi:hypothetical protein